MAQWTKVNWKSIISRDRLNLMNDLVDIRLHNIRLDNNNSADIARNYDIIVDATDNYSGSVCYKRCLSAGKTNGIWCHL
ncbi:MAG: hypothetical protein R2744_04985 [Bacteroidales bacterium]